MLGGDVPDEGVDGKGFYTLKYSKESAPKESLDEIYYDIAYEYIYSGDNLQLARLLRPITDDLESEGERLKGNTMIKHMIQYLLKSDDELNGLTGFTNLIDYRISIMKALALFWD